MIAVMSNRTKKIGILCIAAVAMVVVLNMIWGSSAIDEYKKTTPTELPSAAEKVLHEVLTCIEKDDMKKLYSMMFSSDYGIFTSNYAKGLFAEKDFCPVKITGNIRKVAKSTSNNVLIEIISIKRSKSYYISLVEYKNTWKVAGISQFKLPK